MSRAEPVRVTKGDGTTFVTSAATFRHRTEAEAEPTPEPETPDGAITMDMLEEMVIRTYYHVMKNADTLSARNAAANGATKLVIAGKYRLGPEFGAGLDDTP